MMLLVVSLLIASKDYDYRKICDRRDLCYNNCNRIYFPSLLCNDYMKNLDGTNVEIVLYGNTFNKFFKFANPAYVHANFDKDAAVTQDLQASLFVPIVTPGVTGPTPEQLAEAMKGISKYTKKFVEDAATIKGYQKSYD